MGNVPRWVTVPVLRAWVASKTGEVNRLPRPVDAPESHSIGFNSDRVLIFGGGPAVGWGVLSHEIALPGALGRALSSRTGRGADVHVAAVPQLKVGSAVNELSRIKLHCYDAIVVTLGVNDAGALTSLAAWRRDLTNTLRLIARQSSSVSRIFVAGVHPIRSIPVYNGPLGSIADAHARKMNAISAEVCSLEPRATYVSLTAPQQSSTFRSSDAMSYLHWGEELADRMAPQLDAERLLADLDRTLSRDQGPDAAKDRAAAVLELGILHDDRTWQFDSVIAQACTTFGVRSATVSVIDSGHLVHKAQTGNVPQLITLGASFTASVIRERDGMMVPDAGADARFRNLPHVAGEPRIRFYAGFPVESPNGNRIGTLNIFDPEPQFACDSDRLPVLRQLGLMAQAEVRRGADGRQ
ncbi:MAG: diguanylate cyclase [Glaciihabitans sp.]|nr:diguanylate cyclase [Glaciihabitans sp.]